MAITALPGLSKINTAHSIDATTPSYPSALGDAPLMWYTYVNSIFKSTDYMANGITDGQFAVAHSTNGFSWVTMSGDATTTNAGVVTISAGVVTPAKMSAAAKAQYLTAIAELDLNAASATVPIGLITNAATIVAIKYVYTVASSTGTGVTVQVGKQGSMAFFATSTSAASQAQYTVSSQTVLNSGAVAANDFLICSTTGTPATTSGRILVCLTLETN